MFKKILIVVPCVLIMISMVACGSTKLGKGSIIVFTLESNPTTGFDWSYELESGDDKGELEFLEGEYTSDAPAGIVGAGGVRTFKFKGVKEGAKNIIFTYKRNWEGGEIAYDVMYELEIDKNMKITCLSKQKGVVNSDKNISDFPDPTFE